MKDDYHKTLNSLDNYIKVLGDKDYTFNAGEEQEFVNFINEYVESIYKNKCGFYGEVSINSFLAIFYNSLQNFDYERLWKIINKRHCCNDTYIIYEVILKRISSESFYQVINELDDFRIVYDYYILYAHANSIPFNQILDKYLVYLEEYQKRSKKSIEEIVWYFTDDLIGYTELVEDKDLSDMEKELKYSFNGIISTIENNAGTKKQSRMQETIVPRTKIICKYLNHVNLNYPIKNSVGVRPLKNRIAEIIYKCLYPDYSYENVVCILKKFLSLNPGIYFDGDEVCCDTFQLNMIIGNKKEAIEIFKSNEFQIHRVEQYNELKKRRHYKVSILGEPVNRFEKIMMRDLLSEEELFELLYSGKISIMSVECLETLLNKYNPLMAAYPLLKYYDKKTIFYYKEGNEVIGTNSVQEILNYLSCKKKSPCYSGLVKKLINETIVQ